MRVMKRALLVLLAVAGCSDEGLAPSHSTYRSDAAPMSSLTCARRDGFFYKVKTIFRDGTCGAGVEVVARVGGALDPACVRRVPPAAPDACRVEFDHTCPVEGEAGTTVTTTGVIQFNADSGYGAGLWSMRIDRNGQTACVGTYDVTVTKI